MPGSLGHHQLAGLLALATALALAACGGSGAASAGTGTTSGPSAALRFAQCMRVHGVPSFPDPGSASAGAGGVGVEKVPAGLDPQSPAFRSAAKSCARFGTGPGLTPHPMPASQRRRLLALARCIRSHGVPGFPDPSFTAAGLPVIRGSHVNPDDPAFARALRVCRQEGGP